ncbi:PucR family transcriptional regulator [Ruminococcus sp. AF21-3]|nr:PucR family transcriptional regulator [Ruminococcus sp. AF21-3]
MRVYKEYRNETFIKYLEQYSEKKLSGIILKKINSEKDLESKRDFLRKYCKDQRIPLLEMPEELEYWPVIKYVMSQVFDKDIARLKYFKLTHDNFNMLSFSPRKISNQASEVLDLLGSMIENPVALYYTNGNCCASRGDNSDKMVLLDNLEDYTPDILTRFSYSRQQGEFIQYVVRIEIFGEAEVFLVITEKNRELSALDYMALENAIITLMYGFVSEFAQQEIEKKYDHDIVHALLTNTLSRKEMESAVRLLGLNYEQKYQIIVFQTKMDAHGRYDKEFLHEVGVIEGELRALFPGEMIFRNMERIVALHRVSEKETQIALQTKLEELQHTIQRAIQRRKSGSRLLIGIGKVVNGVERLSESYQEAKKALTYIDVIRVVSGNSNRMVVRYSNLGFFQLLGDIEDPSKLLQYIPESLRILHDSDSKMN